MTDDPQHTIPSGTSPAHEVRQLCDAFESEWKTGQPKIESYVADADASLRSELLQALLFTELRLRFGSGETPLIEEYQERFPDHKSLVATAFAIVGSEDPSRSATKKGSASDSDQAETLPGEDLLDLPKGKRSMPRVEGYDLKGELGRGGMGVVYRARHSKLDRDVALKMIIAGEHASPQMAARFVTEARSVASLQHPNIVQVYDIGKQDDIPYMALELVEGGSLADLIDDKGLPPKKAAHLVEQLARATSAAHEAGIIHRDLKPDNVLLTSTGDPKITDFGLAKRFNSDDRFTKTGAIVGTPYYMAPEQASGDGKNVGPAADIWSLGAILYHSLTGRPPFEGGNTLETLERVRVADPIPLHKSGTKLPRDLETICLKCLEKDPQRRYSTAADLADDLRRFQQGETIRARAVSPWQRLARWVVRRKITALLVATLIVVGVLLVASVAWLWRVERERTTVAKLRKPYTLTKPAGLPDVAIPSDNPLTIGRVELGKQLFFDKRLSVDGTVSCASCHDPAKGWSDGRPIAVGIKDREGKRRSQSVVNSAFNSFLFWDGRAGSLEEQSLKPLTNSVEMGMPSLQALEDKLNAIPGYKRQFREVFGTDVTAGNVAKALAAFERTIISGNSPYDRYEAGDKKAMSARAIRGMKLFFGKAHCVACHSGPNFTDNAFHNIGVGMDSDHPDPGRQKVSGLLGDRGAFKTPSLRDVARTAPYMHDGSLKTLKDVVEFYDKGGIKNPQLDEEIQPLNLTPEEQRALVTFLQEGLTSSSYPFVSPPKLPE